MSAARQAIARLEPNVTIAEVRAVAMQAGAQVARECEAAQRQQHLQQQQEQECRRLASNKALLVSLGVAEVGPYLRTLHFNEDIFDEDLARKDELEKLVRTTVGQRFTGGESFPDAQRIAREVIDTELGV